MNYFIFDYILRCYNNMMFYPTWRFLSNCNTRRTLNGATFLSLCENVCTTSNIHLNSFALHYSFSLVLNLLCLTLILPISYFRICFLVQIKRNRNYIVKKMENVGLIVDATNHYRSPICMNTVISPPFIPFKVCAMFVRDVPTQLVQNSWKPSPQWCTQGGLVKLPADRRHNDRNTTTNK